MQITIRPYPCQQGAQLPLVPGNVPCAHKLMQGTLPDGTGISLCHPETLDPFFIVSGHTWLPDSTPILLAKKDMPAQESLTLLKRKQGHAVAVITLSDKGYQGLRQDSAGPLAAKMIAEAIPVGWSRNFLLPDDQRALTGLLSELALTQKYDLICTSGGTGLGPRDITPQATRKVLDLELPGFSQAMCAASLAKTPNAIISRAICGVTGQCLIINLPGSARAVAENLEAILPGLGHALAKLQGDTADCGNQT